MARTVDPARHEARRMHIVDAALTCFAELGVEGATTAAICRRAGIGSGTFFHYFPTKTDVLVAVLDVGTAETRAWFASQEGRQDPSGVLEDYLDRTAAELADPRVAGFVRAVWAVMGDARVAAALQRDEEAVADGLLPWVRAAQRAGEVRDDVPTGRLVTWLTAVVDGFLGQVAAQRLDPRAEAGMLRDVVRRLLRSS